MIGQTLSHFKLTAKLGEGGMGTVYRAEDTRLGREVAVKILPDDFSNHRERLARFEREARILASLNHPNIAALHQVDESDDQLFLVMELVEGTDLAERLARGALPVDECVRIAVGVASGLEAAHARGIVHRDLKPANIKVTPEGEVKILDFGLAKAREALDEAPQELSQSPTLTAQMTNAGVILGTAGYMSPEQARGEQTDQRADIWSFGVVLHELLSGSRLFAGRSAPETLAAVLGAEIDWDRLPQETPPHLRRLLLRCLERDPRRRLHAIADARIELEAPVDEALPAALEERRARRVWRQALLAALGGAIVTLVIVAFFGSPATRSSRERPLRRLEVVSGVGVDFFSVQWGLNVSDPRVSPDGSMVVYPADGRLWIRDMDGLEPRVLESTQGAFDAFWSPDGRRLAYVAGSELRRIEAEGGPSVVLSELDGAYLGGTWGEGDRIVVGLAGRGLVELPGQGGQPRMLLAADSESGDFDFHSPTFLGDGDTLAFILHEQNAQVCSIEILTGSERRAVYRASTASRLTSLAFDTSSRRLVFATIRANAGLWALSFDPEGPATEAEAQLLIAHGLAPSIAADGSLVYVDGLHVEPARLARVDRTGTMIGEVGQALWDMDRPVASPDGSLVGVIATHSGSREIWVQDLERDTALRVTTDPPQNYRLTWADGGEAVVYATGRGETSQLVKQRADGEGEPTVLIEGQIGHPSIPGDGSFVVYQAGGARMRKGPGDIWWFPLGQPEAAAPLVATPADEVQPAVSPDGQLLAYSSDESQRYEVYLRPLAGEGKRLRVSARGGVSPFWARDGRELYYIEDSTLMAVSVEADGQSLGSPERLFSGADVASPLVQNGIGSITLGPEGDFIVVQNRIPGSPRVVVVENWTALLEH